MINTKSEKLLRLDRVSVPGRQRVHRSVVERWRAKGCHGVKLETVRIAGRTFTSVEAVQRFIDAMNNAPVRIDGAAVYDAEQKLAAAGM